MKIYIIILIIISFYSCKEIEYKEECETITRTVKDKKEGIETKYEYTENLFGSGDSAFKKVPNTHSYYVILFDDGHTEKVSLETYMKYDIGIEYKFKDCKKVKIQ